MTPRARKKRGGRTMIRIIRPGDMSRDFTLGRERVDGSEGARVVVVGVRDELAVLELI
jgi:hypothetical protein